MAQETLIRNGIGFPLSSQQLDLPGIGLSGKLRNHRILPDEGSEFMRHITRRDRPFSSW
jgi:hypothetical protein